MSNDGPCTVEELAALPEGGGFSIEERLIDGVMRRCPVAPAVGAFYLWPNLVTGYVDANGVRWRLGRYLDGRWFRQRA